MDQRAYRCQHGQLNGLGSQCYSKCRQVAEPARVAVEQVQVKPKHTKTQAPRGGLVDGAKADAGRIGGASTSPAKTAAAKVNGARGGRPRKVVAS
jgi:hypothetical protein